jgi:hypothetical protein
MADEFKLKEVKTEIKQKLDSLFYVLKDAQKVYEEINRKGYEVGYPEIVAHLQNHPVARTLPLENKYKDRIRAENRKNKKTKPINSKPIQNVTIQKKQDPPAKELYTTLTTLLQIRAKERGWAYEQAVIFDSITSRQYNIEKTIRVLQAYKKQEENREPYNPVEIAKEAGTKMRTTRNILERLNLSPKLKINIDSELEQAIKNATEIDEINEKLAAHFLRMPIEALRAYIKENNLRSFGFVTNCYLHASKAYEAQDAGFNNKETAEYAGTIQRNLKFLLSKRAEFEEKIIQILKKIYPNKEITKPYI